MITASTSGVKLCPRSAHAALRHDQECLSRSAMLHSIPSQARLCSLRLSHILVLRHNAQQTCSSRLIRNQLFQSQQCGCRCTAAVIEVRIRQLSRSHKQNSVQLSSSHSHIVAGTGNLRFSQIWHSFCTASATGLDQHPTSKRSVTA